MSNDVVTKTEAEILAEERAEYAERALTFAKLGIDIDAGPGKYLFAGYDGDLTKEAVTAAAIEAGAMADPTVATTPDADDGQGNDPADAGQQEHRNKLAGGAPAGAIVPEDPHPIKAALKEFHAGTGRREDRAIDFLAALHEARERGDGRVMFDQEKYNKEATKHGERMRTRGTGGRVT